MALTVQPAPQSKGEASTIGLWQEFQTGISGGIRLLEFGINFVRLLAIPRAEYLHYVLVRNPPERISGQSEGISRVNGGACQVNLSIPPEMTS